MRLIFAHNLILNLFITGLFSQTASNTTLVAIINTLHLTRNICLSDAISFVADYV